MKLRTLKHYTLRTAYERDPVLIVGGQEFTLDAGKADEVDVFHELTNPDLLIVTSKNWHLDYFGCEFISLSGDVEPESVFFQGEQCNEVHPKWNALSLLGLTKCMAGWMQ